MPEMALQVRPLQPEQRQSWQGYVLDHPNGTVFHRLEWSDAVAAAYGHRALHLTAWQGDRLAGVLPLFLVKSPFVGKVLVSVPYATYGGVLGDTPAVAAALYEHAKSLMKQHAARYLEFRHREAGTLDLPEISRYDTFRRELPGKVEEVLAGLPRKARAAARGGLSSLGDDCTRTGNDAELVDIVYDLYSITLRRLGSPNYSRKLFHELRQSYGDDCVALVVRDAGKPIAGVISYIFRDEIVPYFSGSLDEGMRKNANNVMYLRLMEYAVKRGLRRFDFNRTRRDNSGPYDFKRHHGFEPSPLHYQIALADGVAMPNLTPSNRKFALAGNVWKKLPLGLTRLAGAVVSRWIP